MAKRLEARVKDKKKTAFGQSIPKVVTAFGGFNYHLDHWSRVPDGAEAEAEGHSMLDVQPLGTEAKAIAKAESAAARKKAAAAERAKAKKKAPAKKNK